MVRESLLALARFPWPRRSPRPRLTAAFWLCGAIISIASALKSGLMFMPGDLFEVQYWFSAWGSGLNPYVAVRAIDYPPHAFAVIWLMNLIPGDAGVLFYAIANVVCCVAAAVLVVRWFAESTHAELTPAQTLAFVGMLLCTRAMRRAIEWGQTAPLVIALFMLALLLAKRRPILAGIVLALASFKLNLTAGFGLAFLLIGYITPLVVAACAVTLITIVFAWWIHIPVFELVQGFLRNVTMLYGGEEFVRGVTSMRTVLADAAGTYAAARPIYFAFVLVLFAALIFATMRRRALDPKTQTMAVLACLLWSFASLTHQRYNTVLLLPAIWMIRWPESGLVGAPLWRGFAATCALAVLTVNIPQRVEIWSERVLRELPHAAQMTLQAAIVAVTDHGTRVVVLCVFALFVYRLAMGTAAPGAPPESHA